MRRIYRYVYCRNETKWWSQWFKQFKQLLLSPKITFEALTGFGLVKFTLPVRCSTNWATEPHVALGQLSVQEHRKVNTWDEYIWYHINVNYGNEIRWWKWGRSDAWKQSRLLMMAYNDHCNVHFIISICISHCVICFWLLSSKSMTLQVRMMWKTEAYSPSKLLSL